MPFVFFAMVVTRIAYFISSVEDLLRKTFKLNSAHAMDVQSEAILSCRD